MTVWINSIIGLVCKDLNLNFSMVHNAELFDHRLDLYCKENNIDFLSYTNTDYQFVKDLSDFRGFHVIRDPRDIVVSAYFSHLHSHPTKQWPELVEHRKKLESASQDEGLYLEMEFRKKEFEDLYNWDYTQANVLELKMENVIISPYDSMIKAFSHLALVDDNSSMKRRFSSLLISSFNRIGSRSKGLIPFRISQDKIQVDLLLGYVFQNRFDKISRGRKQGEEDLKSHYRKGVSGDWANHFNQDHRDFFKEHYNDLLIKLGYESDSNW